MKKHIDELNKNYGSSIMINLIDKKGDQNEIGTLFNNLFNSLVYEYSEEKRPEFIWFDFHENCKKMRYENLNILISSQIFKKFLSEKQYFHALIPSLYNSFKKFHKRNFEDHKIKIISEQKGVFRTNCIDCLDRTNIVQTLISRHLTQQIIGKLNICTKKSYTGKVFEKFKNNFENDFKNLWSNHGDAISYAYTGTQAQKSDFTRTGKRTYLGTFKDFLIGAKRFFINNVNDSYNQECQELFLNRVPIAQMQITAKPSDKVFKSLAILTLSYFIIWLTRNLKRFKALNL